MNGPRVALAASLGIMWLNYALTARWAHIAGSVHGAKEPVFVGVLSIATLLVCLPWQKGVPELRLTARITGWTGLAVLIVCFLVWFPPRTWVEIPFLDNWPARFTSTMDGIALLRRGAVVGWQWHYLGGYHLSSDVTQSHTVLALVPVWLAGPAVGFHVLHLVLFLSLPLLVFVDLKPARTDEDDDTRYLAAGLTAITTAGFSYLLLRSGDTNSLAGVACTLLALTASRSAARGTKWGGPLLVGALVLLNYVHAGFLIYAAAFLVLESVFYRDWHRLLRALVATFVALIAGLPLYWESWRYPEFFIPNNVVLDRAAPFQLMPFLRKIYYNVELMWLPGRWFNDFSGLAGICLPITLYVAWKVRSRAGLYAWIALATIGVMRFNTPEFAYLFLRPIHVLAVCLGPILAVFIARYVGRRLLAITLIALVAAYLQILLFTVPHVPTLRDGDPALVDRVAAVAEGKALVLVENTPHRDMDADPSRTTEPTPFAAHVEQILGTTTGRRLYAGLWDGWQWSPARDQVLAGGAFRGRAIEKVPLAEFEAELRKWGVRHLIVWSQASLAYLRLHNDRFVERWASGAWHDFEFLAADAREVVAETGTGRLTSIDPLAARVSLDGLTAGTTVIVRTNYHPSWTARVEGTTVDVPLRSVDGQLAFSAPTDGAYVVALTYPRRPWMSVLALAALVLGCVALSLSTKRVDMSVTRSA